jgi:chorismate mutase
VAFQRKKFELIGVKEMVAAASLTNCLRLLNDVRSSRPRDSSIHFIK